MTMRTWRGTVLFTGTLATIAVAAGAKFAGADASAINATGGTGTTTQSGTGTAAGTTSGTAAQAGSTTSKVITGSSVAMPYGNVQVAVTFTGTKITSVQTLRAPNGGRSGQINGYATPILGQEAVAAGSAKIDSVSGATYTSEAYMQSLQSAIDKLGK
jgi:uncharacterized protein with FMN-binding domain